MESSRRILVDRSTIRLDGRPFFTFGPRLLLTPPERLKAAMAEIAAAGFTTVGSPPCSPGTLHLMNEVFDAAEEAGLMVMLIADPRLPEHGRYMAEQFKHRASLHSYVLSPHPATEDGLAAFRAERDSICAVDLFHPVTVPLIPEQFKSSWLLAQDVYTVIPSEAEHKVHTLRSTHQRPGVAVQELTQDAFVAPRPVILPALPACTSDAVRETGIFSDDPSVARLSPRAIDWFPFLADTDNIPRRDFLGPDPEMLRLQVYDALASGARGSLLDFFEAMGGPSPYTGRDRFCEAGILAQEIALLNDFFAEGIVQPVPVETGHPRLDASVIRHGLDYLIVLRMNGYEEDYFIDEAYMQRTGIDAMLENAGSLKAWRLDFPEAQPLEIQRDRAGAARFLAGPVELTGLVLLSPGSQRAQDLGAGIRKRLPLVAKFAVEELEIRYAKLMLIEGELGAMRAGLNNDERTRAIRRAADSAKTMLQGNDFAGAYVKARQGMRVSRQVIKYQMAKALAMPFAERTPLRALLRGSYYTLPRFYRETSMETANVFTDLT